MYIHSDVNEIKDNKKEKIKEDLTDEYLEKFYEERQSFFEESLLNNSKRTNTTKSTNYPSNKRKYKKQNFDNISFHKNILPENIISYEEYKSDNIIINNNNNNNNINKKKSKTKRSFSYKNINSINENNIENDDLKKEINEIQNKKNRNKSKIKYSSFRDKNNINKGLNLENKNNKKDNKKIFEKIEEKNKAISLFPRKMDNFKPSILKKNKEEEIEKEKINISPIQTQSNNSNILTTKYSYFNNYNFETSQTKLNDNYKKDLNEVLYKRKDLENLDNKNNKINNRNNNNLNIYERNKLYSEKSKEKIKVLKQEIEKKEIEECSFYPQLTTDQNITYKYESNNKKIDFYNKNLEWQKKINQSIRDLIVSNDKKTYEECSFHPNTNNKFSNEEIQNFKQPDFIYRKNINWMNKVNEEKKRYELEKMEEIKKEIELIQKENKKATQYLSEERRLMTYDDNLKELSKPKYITPKYTKKNIKRGNSVKNNYKNCDFEINNKIDFKEMQNLILSLKNSLQNNKKMNEKLFNENNNKFVMEIDKDDNINVISSPFDN